MTYNDDILDSVTNEDETWGEGVPEEEEPLEDDDNKEDGAEDDEELEEENLEE